MALGRLLKHLTTTHLQARRLFPARVLEAIEQAVQRSERTHRGQIRVVIEVALPAGRLLRGLEPRTRALELFATLHVWDTTHRNGVLLYVQLADRVVEIIADRGLAQVTPAEWQGVCRLMEAHYRAGEFETGTVAGIDAVGALLARHFPQAADVSGATAGTAGRGGEAPNELPDQPTLL